MVMTMDQKLEELEKSCIGQATVSPHWLPSGDAFWYTRQTQAGKSEFILVDCLSGLRRAAFDHARLAAELAKHTAQEISPDSLPFWWINVARDGAWTRFQFDDRTWQYENNGNFELWHGEFDNGNFDRGCKEVPSPQSLQTSTITFENHTTSSLTYSWIDNSGEPQYYGTLVASQRKVRPGYVGHLWRLAIKDSDKSIACIVKDKPSVAMIEELPSGLIIRWGTDKGADDSDSAQDTPCPETGFEVFVRDFNVWIKNPDGTETPISNDGSVDNEFKKQHLYPSTDGKYVVAWQCKPESKHLIHLIESSPKNQLQPKLRSIQYLTPGDNVVVQRPRLFDLVARQEILVDDTLFRNPYVLTEIGWSKDGKKYRFIFNERGHQHLRLLEIDLSGTVKVLAEESSKTFVDYYHKMYHKVMESKDELLWASERDGWNHLYLMDIKDGTLKNQITKGQWVVRSVVLVDEDLRQTWFEGFGMMPGQDPYHAHLACVNFDGSGLRVVTAGDGTHTWKWAPDRRFLIDSWSRVDFPPRTVLRDAQTGREIVGLEQGQIGALTEAGWVPPERLGAPGRDGETQIYGIIIRPAEFDASKKYPVLEQIYAGPQGYYTPKPFQSLPKLRRLADQGYIVVLADGMGTNWRSKAFHDVCHRNLGDAGFPDRIAWIRAAAVARPWMDLSRVGCYGSSAGGQSAAAAVLHHADFYRAASASAGCHDNRLAGLWWNEMWMGYPAAAAVDDDDDGYRESSNATHAHRLGGALMLAVGGMDASVDPSSTMQLVQALIEADKEFELVFVPKGDHHVIDLPYVLRKQDSFFKRHLQGC